MSKYIDLAEAIHNDGIDAYWDEILAVLRWIDEHADQVPGRTITESEFKRKIEEVRGTSALRKILEACGITIVPDPEPTNAEKLKALCSDWTIGRNCLEDEDLSDYLNRLGVKAPGGDDD